MSDSMLDDLQKLKGERIAKRIARSGVCSRRAAEKLIEEERVTVDGNVVTTPATIVTDRSSIKIDGELLKDSERTRLWLFHKPRGIITSHKDTHGRETVFDLLHPDLPRVISVGRLDYNTEGLILLTNDGELSRYLELPETAWVRRYRARVYGKVKMRALEGLKNGSVINGVEYGPITVEHDKNQSKGHNNWLTLSLKEGKNREIRKVLESFNLKVNRLIRLSYGPFQLGNLPESQTKEVAYKVLQEQIDSQYIK